VRAGWCSNVRSDTRSTPTLEAVPVRRHQISFVGGVFFSVPMAKILAGVINTTLGLLQPPVSIEVSPNIGALVSASISVAVLLRILAKSKRGKMPGLEEEGK